MPIYNGNNPPILYRNLIGSQGITKLIFLIKSRFPYETQWTIENCLCNCKMFILVPRSYFVLLKYIMFHILSVGLMKKKILWFRNYLMRWEMRTKTTEWSKLVEGK